MRSKKAVFTPIDFAGETNWVASNRAAKRFLQSNSIINLAKKHEVNIIKEDNLLILN